MSENLFDNNDNLDEIFSTSDSKSSGEEEAEKNINTSENEDNEITEEQANDENLEANQAAEPSVYQDYYQTHKAEDPAEAYKSKDGGFDTNTNQQTYQNNYNDKYAASQQNQSYTGQWNQPGYNNTQQTPYGGQHGQPQYQQQQGWTQPVSTQYQQNPQNNYVNPYYVQQGYPQQGYGQYPQQGYPYVPPTKKKSSGARVFVAILVSLIIILFCSLIVVGISRIADENADNGNTPPNSSSQLPGGEDNTNPYEDPTSEEPTDDGPSGIDPNGPQLKLEDLPEDADNGGYTASKAFEKVSPSTVAVTTYDTNSAETGYIQAEGTGIIVSEDGYVVTNSHVIMDTKQYAVTVTLNDGTEYKGKIVGYDTRTDLAVIKIDAKNLVAASFGSSDKAKVGQTVYAIGNPGGINYSNSMTRGIISAVNRVVEDSNIEYIQTDAAINPGNSGGPLINEYGQVLGINTIKIVETGYEGMGFAIPSTTVKKIVDQLISQGYISGRVRIGITGNVISEAAAELYGVPSGIVVKTLASDSPLLDEGVKENDIISHIDGNQITSFQQFYRYLEEYEPGDEVTLTIFREGSGTNREGESFDIKIVLLADLGETQRE